MFDMSGDPFEAELSELFLRPTRETDGARMTLAILERIEREERRRRVVILGAAAVGVTIAGSTVVFNGARAIVALVEQQVGNLALPPVGNSTLLLAASGLAAAVYLGMLANRAVTAG